jgi:hypothetical protein
MPKSPNVTTPGGFFIGLGGIVSFCIVAVAVYKWVKSPPVTGELRDQQVALGLRVGPDVTGADAEKKKAEVAALLDAAGRRYNGGKKPDLDKLDDLRGVVRYREAEKSKAESEKALTSPVAWKDKAKGEVTMPIELAMKIVAAGLKDRKPKASEVKLDFMPPIDPKAAPAMPNAMGGGAKTVIFADPNAPAAPAPAPAPQPAAPAPVPAAPEEPAKPAPAPAPAAPGAPPPAAAVAQPAGSPTAATVPAPNRPPLLNWPESKK